jgi:hypothetical protein
MKGNIKLVECTMGKLEVQVIVKKEEITGSKVSTNAAKE